MARQGYLLVKGDSSDISANGVVLDTLTIRDLITKAEISRITLNPVNGWLTSGHPTVAIPQSLCLTPDGFLYAGYHVGAGAFIVWKIDPETGTSTVQNCLIGLATWQISNYVDNDYIYDWDDNSSQTMFMLVKTNRTTLALESYIQIAVSPAAWTYGLGWDGINWWTGDATNKKIQKRSALNLTVVTDYPYPIGYETASFYCLQIDPENPTHLWLQGEMGSNGVVVVWDTVTQTIVSEWSSADILRWKDQQFAIGGADIPVPGELHFLTLPTITGTTLLPLLIKNNNDYWAKVVMEFAIVVDGVPGAYSPCTQGAGGDDLPWLGPFEETLKHFSWNAGADLSPGSYIVMLHMKLEKVV